MEPVGHQGQNGPFSRSKRSPKQVNLPFCQYSCAIVHGIFGYPDFRPHFCQNLTWTSVKTLSIEPIGTHGQNNLFSRLNDPRSRISTSFLLKFYIDIRKHLKCGASWPLRLK
ncbi:hypothetical protein H5410_064076 [Solanum commersonii]|uniref:Uncharacterized protein n=1 Tax=Solanum commersonii TaxID=4109 RepID=A0A9J5W0H0_SOLCO|nr:hypothetical protein H5410_064076 [Solanum commersonii]